MPGWGEGAWGFGAWGFGVPEAAAGLHVPQIALRTPLPNSFNIPVNTSITVGFFDADADIDSSTALVELNGVTAYTGGSGFANGFIGTVSYVAGALIVKLFKPGGWGYSTQVTVHGYVEDNGGRIADDSWSWTTVANSVCYTGLSPLAIETALLTPMDTFLELEPTRQLMLNNVLQTTTSTPHNMQNKAARVIYQSAFNTELSTVLNGRVDKDKAALGVTVCEKQKGLILDQVLNSQRDAVLAGIQQLYTLRAVTPEYINSFSDYRDSLLFNYRNSAVANVLLLAKAIELAS